MDDLRERIAAEAVRAVERHMAQVDCSCDYDLDSVCWYHMSDQAQFTARVRYVADAIDAVLRLEQVGWDEAVLAMNRGVPVYIEREDNPPKVCPTCGSERRDVRYCIDNEPCRLHDNCAACPDPWHASTEGEQT